MARPLLVALAALQLASAEIQGEVDVATSGLYLVEVPVVKDELEGGQLKRSLRRGAQVAPGVGIMALGAYLWHKGGPHPLESTVVVQELPVHVLTEPKPTESHPRWPFALAALAFVAAMPILRLRRRRALKEAAKSSIVPVTSKVGSGVPGDPRAYDGIIGKREGTWALNGSSGQYRFDPLSGWLVSGTGDEKLGRFICKQIQDGPLDLPVNSYSKIMTNFKIVSSEIMTEIQKPENAGALFVLPSQLNGAEYPSHMHVVKTVEEYKADNTGGPRGQLAVHPAVAQFVLDNAASSSSDGGINAIDEILNLLEDLELVNGYLKVHDVDSHCELGTLEKLVKSLNKLRPLVMEEVPACGLTPDKKGFAENSHKVGLVYASAVPVDSYMNQGGKVEFQVKISELILIGQYYGALKYAAEVQRSKGSTAKRKVYLMPLGGGVFNNPWDIIAKSMAKAIQLLDNDLLSLLDISALAWSGNPSEEQKLKIILSKLNSQAPVPSITLQPPGGKTQLFRIATGQPDEEPEPFMKRMMTDMSDVSDRPLVLEEQTEMFRMQTGETERLPSPRMPSPRQAMRKVEEAPGEEEAEKEAEAAEAEEKAEDARRAEEAKNTAEAAEAKRKAEEALEAEEARKTAEAAEAKRKAEEALEAEEAKKTAEAAEAKRKAEEAKKTEEAKNAKKAAEAAEAKRKAEEAKKTEEAKKAAEAAEAKRKAEEATEAEEAKKTAEAAEAKRKAEDAKKAEQTKKAARKAFEAAKKADEAKASEAARKAEETRKAEDAKKWEAAEAKKKAEAAAQKAEETRRAEEAKKDSEAAKKKPTKGRKESKESAFLGSVEEAKVSPRFEKGHGLKPVSDRNLTPRGQRVSAKTPEQLPAQDTPRRGLNSSLVGNPGQTIRQLAHALEFNEPPTYSPSSSRAGSPTKSAKSSAKDSKAAASE